MTPFTPVVRLIYCESGIETLNCRSIESEVVVVRLIYCESGIETHRSNNECCKKVRSFNLLRERYWDKTNLSSRRWSAFRFQVRLIYCESGIETHNFFIFLILTFCSFNLLRERYWDPLLEAERSSKRIYVRLIYCESGIETMAHPFNDDLAVILFV